MRSVAMMAAPSGRCAGRAGLTSSSYDRKHAADCGRGRIPATGFTSVLRQAQNLAGRDCRPSQVVALAELPNAFTRIAVVRRCCDRPESVARLHAVHTGLAAGAGVSCKQGPGGNRNESNKKKSNEHVFAMMHEQVFAVKRTVCRLRGRRPRKAGEGLDALVAPNEPRRPGDSAHTKPEYQRDKVRLHAGAAGIAARRSHRRVLAVLRNRVIETARGDELHRYSVRLHGWSHQWPFQLAMLTARCARTC
jgi:hypothetical protein